MWSQSVPMGKLGHEILQTKIVCILKLLLVKADSSVKAEHV